MRDEKEDTGELGEFLYPLGLSSPVLSVIEGHRYKYNIHNLLVLTVSC